MILVTVGTHEQPMNRLSLALEGLSAAHPALGPFWMQHGYSRLPRGWQGASIIAETQLKSLVDGADIVIAHGGPATIDMVRRSGKIPIVVPRRKYAQEHIDDHQFWYAERLAQGGEVIVVDDLSDLPSVVIRWREIAAQLPPPAGIDPAEAVRRFRNFVNELLP